MFNKVFVNENNVYNPKTGWLEFDQLLLMIRIFFVTLFLRLSYEKDVSENIIFVNFILFLSLTFSGV